MKRLSILILLSFVFISCGKKGAPKPPETFAPAVVTFFSASGAVNGVTLSWQQPEQKANGDALDDLLGFRVMKRLHSKDGRPRYRRIAEIPVKKSSEESAKDPAKKKPESEAGVSYSVLDPEVEPGKRYEYYVTAYNEDRVEGVFSPVLRVTFVGESSIVENVSSLN